MIEWNKGDRVVLPGMGGKREGTIVAVQGYNWYSDGEIKIVFDDDLSDTGMWYPPNAVLPEGDNASV